MLPFIIVAVIGIIIIVVSCVLVDNKVEATEDVYDTIGVNHITDEYELNEDEVAILQKKVSDRISTDVNNIITDADRDLASITNEKMSALGDYAVTVCDEIEKNHKEVMFLYSMLNDKEKELKNLVSSAEGKASELRKANELAMESYVAAPSDIPEMEPIYEEDVFEEEATESTSYEPENTNDIILEMKRNGMSILEIARQLGLGVGEVKLVIDLYQNRA